MRYLLSLLSLILFLAMIMVVGDYYNVPLWPVNFLNKLYPLTLICSVSGYDSAANSQLIASAGGVTLYLTDAEGNALPQTQKLRMVTDTNGRFVLHVPQGEYLVRGELMAYRNGSLLHLATGSAGDYVKVVLHGERKPIALTLKEVTDTSPQILMSRFNKFLREGYLDAALLLEKQMQNTALGHLPQSSRKKVALARTIIPQIQNLTSQLNTTATDDYVQKVQLLEQIEGLFTQLLPHASPMSFCVREAQRTIYVHPKHVAFLKVLEKIWSEYLQNVQNFLQIYNYTRAFYYWQLLVDNPQIFNEHTVPSEKMKQEYETLSQRMEEVKKRLRYRLSKWMEKGQAAFNINDLDNAETYFSKASKVTEQFAEKLEIDEELVQEVAAYIQDLKTLKQAAFAFELQDWQRVLRLYQQVQHESPWLKVKKREIQLRLQSPQKEKTPRP